MEGRKVRIKKDRSRPDNPTVSVVFETGRGATTALDPYVTMFYDRHGKMRFRFRRGETSVYLPTPDSTKYRPAYEAALSASKPDDGLCYFVGARQVGLVKIGYARNVEMRVSHLQVNSPVEVELMAIADGGKWREREYHIRFANDRVRGEWFKLTPEIEEEIERLVA